MKINIFSDDEGGFMEDLMSDESFECTGISTHAEQTLCFLIEELNNKPKGVQIFA